MPDIRLQALPQANILDQALAVGGESIYDLLGISRRSIDVNPQFNAPLSQGT